MLLSTTPEKHIWYQNIVGARKEARRQTLYR